MTLLLDPTLKSAAMKFLLALALATLTDAFLGRSAVRVQQRRNVAAPMMALPIDCKGKVAFVSGMADPNGYGWAITKALAEAGATIIVGVWPPMLRIFEMNLKNGKFDDDMRLPDGSMMKIEKVYAQDAVFDTPEDVPADIASNKRYAGLDGFTISEVAAKVKADYGTIDILVHSIANGPEVTKPLLEVSRAGYLAASSASAYSMVSLVQRFGPFMNPGGSVISLSYFAAEKTIPGYGGGMSSAKAQLESDTRTLAFEAGRKYGIRVNTLSAGPLKSRAATAISAKGQKAFIDFAIDYSKARARARVSAPLSPPRGLSLPRPQYLTAGVLSRPQANAPMAQDLYNDDVGAAACFLLSPLARAITGVTLYVDNGLHSIGMAVDSSSMTESPVVEQFAPQVELH